MQFVGNGVPTNSMKIETMKIETPQDSTLIKVYYLVIEKKNKKSNLLRYLF